MELDQLRDQALGVVLVGDINVHSERWLVHSTGNSIAGERLREICMKENLRQLVRKPARGDNLLDLVITDIESVSVVVAPKTADHAALFTRLNLSIPRTITQ